MSNRFVFLCAVLITTIGMHAQEPIASAPNTNTKLDTPALQAEKPIKPKPNALTAFTRFIRIFVALLRNPEVKENLKLIENLLVALLQTVHQVAQNAKGVELTQTRSLAGDDNDALIAELSRALVSESELLKKYKACTHQKHSGMDDQTKAILLNFAAIVQNFFNILQDPENKDNVAPNLMGMVAGMMNIGTIAVTKGNVALDTDDEIALYAHKIDAKTKRTMHRMIFTAQERCSMLIDS